VSLQSWRLTLRGWRLVVPRKNDQVPLVLKVFNTDGLGRREARVDRSEERASKRSDQADLNRPRPDV
jgi:hypothetical protein